MTEELKKYIVQWLLTANDDAFAANRLFNDENQKCGIICYHCQQAIEKFLKAFLINKGEQLIKTHNLNLLLDSCKKYDLEFNDINLLDISQYAINTRYPGDDFFIPTVSETETFLNVVEEIKKLVEEKIKL